ncbi:MAG: FtsX-like permease family protein [Nitriliruptorales bacterium]|nr:FtsX-like permease family protein [Nitriliruptorales bacterium]
MRRVLAALRAHPQMAVAVLAAALVVGLTRAAGPLFAVAARDAATADALATLGPRGGGLEVAMFGYPGPDVFPPADAAVREAVGSRVRVLGEPDTVLISRPVEVVAGSGTTRTRLMYRDGAVDNVEILDGDGSAALVPDVVANRLGLEIGDRLTVNANRRSATVVISGVYRDIGAPVPEFWETLRFHFVPVQPPPLGVEPPPVVFVPRETHLEVVREVNEPSQIFWRFPLENADLTFRDILTISARYDGIDRATRDQDVAMGAALEQMMTFGHRASAHSQLQTSAAAVRDASVALSASTDLLTVAAQILALLVVAIAGMFAVRARRTEARRAWAQGDSPSRFGLRLTAEAAIPVLLGAGSGGVAAWYLIDVAGPGDGLSVGVIGAAVLPALAAGLLALLLLWIVTSAVSSGEFRQGEAGAVRRALSRVPWELVPILLAGFLLYELLTRGTAVVETESGAAQVDPLLVAFPFLALIAVAAIGARFVGTLLAQLRNRGGGLPNVPFLAIRRLGAAGGLALALTGTVAAAIGLAVYAVTVRASLDTTLQQKAAVAVGAPTTVRVPSIGRSILDTFPFEATAVLRTEAETVPDGVEVQLFGVEPDRFADTALLPGQLSELADLVPQLRWDGEGGVPALLGPGTDTTRVETAQYGFDLEVVGRIDAFSRQDDELGLVVVDAAALLEGAEGASVPVRVQHVTEVWADAPAGEVEDALTAAQVLPLETNTADAFAARPALRGLTQTFVLLEALGILAVVLAMTGLALYLRARQDETEVSYVLVRRMGLRPATHGAAIALEVSGLLFLATAIGIGAGIAIAWLLHARLDPLANLPPDALLVIPWVTIGVGAAVLLVAVVGSAALVQRSADRVDPSTVLRHAE